MADIGDDQQAHGHSVGDRLRVAREARGMSLDEVATRTRIPVRHLQHIERGEWDALPASTYSVGFARSYGHAVGLDGAEIGREVRDLIGSGRTTYAPAPEYYEPADPARVPPRSLALIASIIAIMLVVAYTIWRSNISDPVDPVQQPDAQAQVPVAAAAQPTQPPAPATGTVTLAATEEVWLRIDDGNAGAALFQGTLAAGQRFDVPPTAQRPVIRTGRPQVLRVSVGGRDIGPLMPTERTVRDVSLLAADVVPFVQGAAGLPNAPAASGTPPAVR